jgi:carbon storage regulator
MLVLTRKAGEQIIIGDNIRLTVVSLGNGRVKIGITAPQDVKIDREELHDKKQAAEETSAPPQEQVVNGLHNRIAGKFPAEPTSEKPVARSPIARRKSR